jgi:primary-amine oxidase
MPTGLEKSTNIIKPYKPRPPNEYIHEYQRLRTDLKPLNIVQPEGVSFKVTEREGLSTLKWQKWHMHVGFNQREGMVLYDVRTPARHSRSLVPLISLTSNHECYLSSIASYLLNIS